MSKTIDEYLNHPYGLETQIVLMMQALELLKKDIIRLEEKIDKIKDRSWK